jgi:hypothetical protein
VGSGLLEDALLLLVYGGPVRHGVFYVDGDRVSLELDPLGCGGKINEKTSHLLKNTELLKLPALE